MTGKRKWMLRVGAGSVLVVVAAGSWVAINATALKAMYAARQLRGASSDDERAGAADRLVALGDHGMTELLGFLRTGNDSCRSTAAGAIDRHLAALPDGDPRAVTISGQLLDTFPGCDDAGRRAILELLPVILKRTGNTHAARCREAVASGLAMSDPASRLVAIRLSLHPDVKMRGNLIPLLSSPEPEIRRAALFAAASVGDGDSSIADEELFRWLHDPDEGVRQVCYDTLVSRDRSEAEIALGRRLSHPNPGERLKLLMDLRYDDDVADPEPWLERLSRDPEPAVRAGAVRVAVELANKRRQPCPGWVGRVADTDPDSTVRRVAGFFRREQVQSGGIRPAGGR